MTVYYVNGTGSTPVGNNSNNGTSPATPFLTIAKAISVWAAGDSIEIQKDSTYAENVVVASIGTAALPNIIEGYNATAGDLRDTMTFALIQLNSGIGTYGLLQCNSSYVTFRNLKVSTTAAYALFVNNVSKVSVINCTFNCTTTGAIYCYNIYYGMVIKGNYFINGGDSSHGSVNLLNSTSVFIIDNVFAGSNTGNIGCIYLYSSSSGNVIEGNYFTASNADAITIGADALSVNVLVRGNTFHGLGTHHAINAKTNADLFNLTVERNIFSDLAFVVYSSAVTNVTLNRFADNNVYNCSTTGAGAAPYFSTNVIGATPENTITTAPFSTGETLTANPVQHAITGASGIVTYPTLGAVQVQITLPAASHVLNDQTAYGVNGNLSAGTFDLTADRAVQYASGEAAQLATDIVTVTASANLILNAATITLGSTSIMGTLPVATSTDLQQLTAKFAGHEQRASGFAADSFGSPTVAEIVNRART
jgi:hypothetical protein